MKTTQPVKKVNFTKPMLVLKIRDTYKAPYHKTKYIEIKKRHLKTKGEFKKYLEEYTERWSSGNYELQYSIDGETYSTFFRITVRDGKIALFWKESPYTREKYPLWQFVK